MYPCGQFRLWNAQKLSTCPTSASIGCASSPPRLATSHTGLGPHTRMPLYRSCGSCTAPVLPAWLMLPSLLLPGAQAFRLGPSGLAKRGVASWSNLTSRQGGAEGSGMPGAGGDTPAAPAASAGGATGLACTSSSGSSGNRLNPRKPPGPWGLKACTRQWGTPNSHTCTMHSRMHRCHLHRCQMPAVDSCQGC